MSDDYRNVDLSDVEDEDIRGARENVRRVMSPYKLHELWIDTLECYDSAMKTFGSFDPYFKKDKTGKFMSLYLVRDDFKSKVELHRVNKGSLSELEELLKAACDSMVVACENVIENFVLDCKGKFVGINFDIHVTPCEDRKISPFFPELAFDNYSERAAMIKQSHVRLFGKQAELPDVFESTYEQAKKVVNDYLDSLVNTYSAEFNAILIACMTTIANKRSDLNSFFRWIGTISDVEIEQIQDYVNTIRDTSIRVSSPFNSCMVYIREECTL